MRSFVDFLRTTGYPGRGLLVGRTTDDVPVAVYFLTGRSPASRDRRLDVEADRVVVRDPAGALDDPLRHYVAVVRRGPLTLVGNGTQVAELPGRSPRDVLAELADHDYEPDPPILTPRIVAVATADEVGVAGVRAAPDGSGAPLHQAVYARRVPAGSALGVTTYAGGTADVVVDGRPAWWALPATAAEVGGLVWDALAPDLRVAAVVVRLAAPTLAGAEVLAAT